MAIQSFAEIFVPWAKAFVLTELVEAPIYRRVLPTRWTLALAASAITHPFVWFAFPKLMYTGLDYVTTSVLSEAFAVAVEAIFFWRVGAISIVRASLVSLLANAASVAVGLALRYGLNAV